MESYCRFLKMYLVAASRLAGSHGSVNRSRRRMESYCRFLKMYLVAASPWESSSALKARAAPLLVRRRVSGAARPAILAISLKVTLSSRAAVHVSPGESERQPLGSTDATRASYTEEAGEETGTKRSASSSYASCLSALRNAFGSSSGTGTVTKRSTHDAKRDATM